MRKEEDAVGDRSRPSGEVSVGLDINESNDANGKDKSHEKDSGPQHCKKRILELRDERGSISYRREVSVRLRETVPDYST